MAKSKKNKNGAGKKSAKALDSSAGENGAVSEKTAAAETSAAETPTLPHLFQPLTLRGLTFRNRIWLPPMDTYSAFAHDGKPTSFHYQHYVSRALGGFGAIITEATAVSPEGRISPCDLGLWNDDQIGAWSWIAEGIHQAGAVPASSSTTLGGKAPPAVSAWAISTLPCPGTKAAGRPWESPILPTTRISPPPAA